MVGWETTGGHRDRRIQGQKFNFKKIPAVNILSTGNSEGSDTSGSRKDEVEDSHKSQQQKVTSLPTHLSTSGEDSSGEDSSGEDSSDDSPLKSLSGFGDLLDFAPISNPKISSEDAPVWDSPPDTISHLSQAAIVILAYDRPVHLEKCLKALQKAKFSSKIKTFVSTDGNNAEVSKVIEKFESITHLIHPRKVLPNLHKSSGRGGEIITVPPPATMYLAKHYRWALGEVLSKREHTHAIILEDDLVVSKDFLSMMEQAAPLLDIDESLWCVSSWNDNGYLHLDLPRDKFFRTSFFPGLGWMMKRSLWESELADTFPADQWDHWMRVHSTSKGRECLVPFLSRNQNIGLGGANSNSQFFKKNLKSIGHHDDDSIVPFGDLSGLLLPKYDTDLSQKIKLGKYVSNTAITFPTKPEDDDPSWMSDISGSTAIVLFQNDKYEKLSKKLQIYPTQRTMHDYAIQLKYRGTDVILVNRRLSSFVPKDRKQLKSEKLVAVAAATVDTSCNDVCEGYKNGYDCDKQQFDFINQCKVLSSIFDCSKGCRRDWGKDIPNFELDISESESQFGGHQCLVTEEIPTCEARHPKTQRLCPCIPRSHHQQSRNNELNIIASDAQDLSCTDACQEVGKTCDASQFNFVNDCEVLKSHFPCTKCITNQGQDIPNYVSEADDANFGKCLMQRTPPTCNGSHRNTRRLCPCVG